LTPSASGFRASRYIIVWDGASRDGAEIFENIHEIVMAAERAKRFGFDYIAYKPVLERRDDGAEVMDPVKAQRDLAEVLDRIRKAVDEAKQLADETFSVYESTNLRVLEQGNWQDFTKQPRTCHMQALRQVLSPMGLYNCPAHRGVAKAKIAERSGFADAGAAAATGHALGAILDRFDASHECREVTCLYNGVNWWLEKMIEDPQGDGTLEPGEEGNDFFL
jgi:hypothetical protein